MQTQPDLSDLAANAQARRASLLRQRDDACADLPLRFWRQQAHFTTPASGTPEKAIRGLASVPKLLDRFGVDPALIAERTGCPESVLQEVLAGDGHSPFVMVDVEDAVALTEESIQRARDGAIRCFTEETWGPALPFFRPAGLRLESCVDDLLTVLTEVAEGRPAETYPVAGIVWPKAEHPEEVVWVCELLSELEERLGLAPRQIKLEFLVESGHALGRLTELAEASLERLAGIIWGIADYSADVNLPRIANDHPTCDWARREIVNVAGAVDVPAIDNMTLNYPTPIHRGGDLTKSQAAENREKVVSSLKETYDDAWHGIEAGMSGKWVGHPLQLLMVLAAYRQAIPRSRLENDIAEIEAYRASVEAGAGAMVLGEGRDTYMADRATDRHLRARLRRATAWGLLDLDRAEALNLISGHERAQIAG